MIVPISRGPRFWRIAAALCFVVSSVPAADELPVLRVVADSTALPSNWSPRPAAEGLRFAPRPHSRHHAVEWQVRAQVPPGSAARIFDDPTSARFIVAFPSSSPPDLHWNQGSHDAARDFEPHNSALAPGKAIRLASFGGRSSDGALPYFNLAGKDGGVLLAVGWTGDWQATFENLGDGRIRVEAGLPSTRFKLAGGEEVRLPSILLLPYSGDWLAGQNRFRRLMLDDFSPPSSNPLQLMPVAASVHGMIGFNDTTETNLVDLARTLARHKLPLDTFWLDAGWNPGGFPRGQGNPEPDPRRFPRGLAPVGAAAREAGLRFLVWFEPERVMRDTAIARDHLDWLLAPSDTPADLRYQEKDGFLLFNLGNDDARRWMTDRVSRQIRDAGIGIYRQDFNLYPAWFWKTPGAPEASALRELHHVSGLYAYLEDLVRQHPGLIVDNCASGGRRLDFEMMRRSVALWRSDSCWGTREFPRSVQAMTYGLSLWLPLHGLGAAATDDLALRSGMGACASFAINYQDPAAVEALRRHLDRYLPIRDLFLHDFHPLTEWSVSPTNVLAFEFHDPSSGRALIQAFRGSSAVPFPDQLRLRGLDPTARYEVTDWDTPDRPTLDGARLLSSGVPLGNSVAADARVLVLRRLPPR